MIRAIVIVIIKEREYSLISPFWLDTIIEEFCWILVINFGSAFSSQIRSSNIVADF